MNTEQLVEHLARIEQTAASRPEPAVGVQRGDWQAARTEGLQAARAQRWREAIPARFTWASIDDFADPAHPEFFAPQVAGELQAWGAPSVAANLVIFGPVGASKTHAAVAAARLKFDRGLDVMFCPVVELLDLLRPGGPEGVGEDLAFTDVVILDDLGAERASEWTAERLDALVNRRWLECLPTIVTTNLPVERLRGSVGERLFSRLLGGGAMVVQMSGGDRRMGGTG